MMRIFVFASLAFAVAAAGCSSNGTGTGTGGNAAADMAAPPADLASGHTAGVPATIQVSVPATFSGTPRQLVVAAFDSLPVTGPPSAILYQANNPPFVAGQTLTVMGDVANVTGTKYVLAVLYMQGGGQLSPMPGVDYTSSGTQTMFTGHAISIGPLALQKLPGDM